MLVSDLDGTLLGDEEALQQFAEWWSENRQFVRLVYNSGRLINSVLAKIETTGLPQPNAVIGGVGTQIRMFGVAAPFPQGSDLTDWPQPLGRWSPEEIREVVLKFQGIELQPEDQQTEFKISFFGEDLTPRTLREIRQSLQQSGFRVELVYSSQRDLDVLPASVNKGTATEFLASHLDLPPERVVVAGDTGNDLAMFDRQFRGIVVANAADELKSLDTTRVYHAQRPFAGGVLEGMRYWLDGTAVSGRATDSQAPT